MKKVIVTGGLGFIGSNLIELLLKKKFFVINIAKVTYSSNFYNTREFTKLKNVNFCKDLVSACKGADLLIIHTEWEEFKAIDFKKMIKKKNFKIYDMRNLYSLKVMNNMGFKYYSIGR